MNGYWAIVALAAIKGSVDAYRIYSDRRTANARLKAAVDRAKAKEAGR